MRAMSYSIGLATFLAAVIGTSVSTGEEDTQQARKAANPRMRIALLNLSYVFKHYDRREKHAKEIDEAVKPFQREMIGLRTRAEKLRKDFTDTGLGAQTNEVVEKQLEVLQRKIDEQNAQAARKVAEIKAARMKAWFIDVYNVCLRHAQAHGFELVLLYNEEGTEPKKQGSPDIARRLEASARRPLQAGAVTDITKDIVASLKRGVDNKSPASSRGDEKKTPAPKRHVACYNIRYIVRNYDHRYRPQLDSLDRLMQNHRDLEKELKTEVEQVREELREARRSEGDEKAKATELEKLNRQLEENQDEIRAVLEMQERTEKRIERDVQEVVRRYSASHDLDLILGYDDPFTMEEYLSQPNIERMLHSRALMPIYAATGVDISRELVDMLNYARRKAAR